MDDSQREQLEEDFFDALHAAGSTKKAFAERVGYSDRFLDYFFAGERESAQLERLLCQFIREQLPSIRRRAGELERRYGRTA
jgi:hypothetical protein